MGKGKIHKTKKIYVSIALLPSLIPYHTLGFESAYKEA
jgi:hypothetical protein